MRRRTPIVSVAERIARRPLVLGVLVLAIGAFLLVVGFLATTGPPAQEKYRLKVDLPAGSPLLRAGQAVRVGGRLAGLISDVAPGRGGRGATVTANLTKPAFRPLPADTEAYVRVHSIVYETYLELRPGTAGDALRDGDRLRAEAESGVDLLEVVQLFDRKAREDLSRTASGLGTGVAGRGAELNAAFADVPELARDASAQLRAATREAGALGRIVAGAAGTARGLRGTRSDDVAGLITSADATLTTTARRGEDLRATLRALPPFEDRLLAVAPDAEALLDDVGALAADLRPAVAALDETLPVANRLLARGDILRDDVDRIADAADPVIKGARPAVRDLFPVMTTLGPLNEDLRTLLTRVGPYRREYRIPGQPGVHKGSGEIAEAGRRLIDATDDPFAGGLKPGEVAWRVLPVLSARPCQNPFPKAGEADRDTRRDGRCLNGGAP